MWTSWKMGRVAGIDVYIHPTFLLLLAYTAVADGGPLSLLLTVAAFGCVLLHEFGHAMMARRFGIETEDITLYPIGGVARLKRMPRSPGAELAIALAGPAVNLAIVAALAPIWVFGMVSNPWEPSLVDAFVTNLLIVNVILAVFNLIPAFPMDGGRVLRALLSGWLGRVRATMIAASLGRVLAVAFGAYCLFVQGNLLQAALAAFIYLAAGAEVNSVLADERRRAGNTHNDVTIAPPGFRWVSVGHGIWQLSPISVPLADRNPVSCR